LKALSITGVKVIEKPFLGIISKFRKKVSAQHVGSHHVLPHYPMGKEHNCCPDPSPEENEQSSTATINWQTHFTTTSIS